MVFIWLNNSQIYFLSNCFNNKEISPTPFFYSWSKFNAKELFESKKHQIIVVKRRIKQNSQQKQRNYLEFFHRILNQPKKKQKIYGVTGKTSLMR